VISREIGNRHGEGGALNNLGTALLEIRRLGEAITAYQHAAANFRESGDPDCEQTALQGVEQAAAASTADSTRRQKQSGASYPGHWQDPWVRWPRCCSLASSVHQGRRLQVAGPS
jgi:hypothetical protein